MSEENVELVRTVFAHAAQGRLDDAIDALNLDADVEMPGAVGGFEEGDVVRGREAVMRALDLDRAVWENRRYDVQRIVDAGERVIALVHEERRGRGSGVEVGADIAFVYSFKEGRVSRIEPYMSQSDALEAAGLSE